jgi:nicotinamide mononucleotide transporter
MSSFEIIAAILGAIAVGLVVLRNVWNFPIGIVMVLMYAWIFYESRLYSDMLLQFIFLVMQIQGWWNWVQGEKGDDDLIAVRVLNQKQWLWSGVTQVAGTLALGFAMKRFTNAALPFLDAFTAVMSVIGQWWLNKRYLENWLFWIVVDVIYLYIYPSRGLYATAILYFIFLIMAITGYMAWKKKTTLPN